MAEEHDRRYIGTSKFDETIGRLLERTEQIQQQNRDFDRTLETFNRMLGEVRDTMAELRTTVKQLNDSQPKHDELESRVAELERLVEVMQPAVSSWQKVKDKAIGWGAIIVLLALAGGGSGFALLKAAFTSGAAP